MKAIFINFYTVFQLFYAIRQMLNFKISFKILGSLSHTPQKPKNVTPQHLPENLLFMLVIQLLNCSSLRAILPTLAGYVLSVCSDLW